MTQSRNDLIDSLHQAIDIARFAPSSHNCQPWQVNLVSASHNEMVIDVLFSPSRMLVGLPSLNREMYLSCGVFSEFLLQALRGQGFAVNPEWHGKTDRLLRVEARLQSVPDKGGLDRLAAMVRSRRTLRGPYPSASLPDGLTHQVRHGFDGNISTHSGAGKMRVVAELVKFYASLDFSNQKAWRETFRYIGFDEKAEREDGFYFSNLFGNTPGWFRWAFRLGLHPLNHRLYSMLGIPSLMAEKLARLISDGGHLITLTAADESPEPLFSAGRDLGRLSLTVHELGWAMHPMSVLVQHDDPRSQLSDLLGLGQPLVYVARLGPYSEVASVAPRRTVESILIPG